MFVVNKNPDRAELNKFSWAMLIGFGVLGAAVWALPWIKGGGAGALAWSGARGQIGALCLWAAGLMLLVLSRGPESLAKPIYVGWMSVATWIGLIVSTVLLTVLFFVLLPVFSLVVRAGDPLRKKLTAGGTYWEDCKPHDHTLEELRRLF